MPVMYIYLQYIKRISYLLRSSVRCVIHAVVPEKNIFIRKVFCFRKIRRFTEKIFIKIFAVFRKNMLQIFWKFRVNPLRKFCDKSEKRISTLSKFLVILIFKAPPTKFLQKSAKYFIKNISNKISGNCVCITQ